MVITLSKNENKYKAIQSLFNEKKASLMQLCEIAKVNRSGYYKWLNRDKSNLELENIKLATLITNIYEEKKGVFCSLRMTLQLNREYKLNVNHKRVYRLMRAVGLRSICRKKKFSYVKCTPEVIAENVLNRKFSADKTSQKWLTDVTEFKLTNGTKAYLSAILDLGDRSIVSYVIGKSNNNNLVFETFNKAIEVYPNAKPIFHSDRGYQYTSRVFKSKLLTQGMIQSMSRVGHCIDNAPMEGFLGILKV
ncbi:IS3 family transposase, partial [Clostridioides difficile]